MNMLIKVQDGVKTTSTRNGFFKEEVMMSTYTKKNENAVNINREEDRPIRKAFDCEADGSFAEPITSVNEQDWTPIVNPTRDTSRRPEHNQEEVFVKIPMGFLDRFAERRVEARRKLERDSYFVNKSMVALDSAIKDFFAYLYEGRDDQKIASAEFAVGLLCDLENILADSDITIDNRTRQTAGRCVNNIHDTLFNLISALAEGEKIMKNGRRRFTPSWADLLNLL